MTLRANLTSYIAKTYVTIGQRQSVCFRRGRPILPRFHNRNWQLLLIRYD